MNITEELEKERWTFVWSLVNVTKNILLYLWLLTIFKLCSALKPEYINNFNNMGLFNFPKIQERPQSSCYKINSVSLIILCQSLILNSKIFRLEQLYHKIIITESYFCWSFLVFSFFFLFSVILSNINSTSQRTSLFESSSCFWYMYTFPLDLKYTTFLLFLC